MRLSKVMGLAVVLVALAVAINALAFKTATVNNTATFTVSGTGSAALAIEAASSPGTGFTTSGIASGSLTLAIQDQMQPNSVYKFANVFQVTNKAYNTTTSITGVGYSFNPALPAGYQVKLYKAGTTTELNNDTLASGASIAVDMEVTVPSGASTGAQSITLVITGNQ